MNKIENEKDLFGMLEIINSNLCEIKNILKKQQE